MKLLFKKTEQLINSEIWTNNARGLSLVFDYNKKTITVNNKEIESFRVCRGIDRDGEKFELSTIVVSL